MQTQIIQSDHPVAQARGSARKPLLDGHTVHIRRLHPNETAVFLEHLTRLDDETRRLRFGNPVNDHFLERYASLALGTDALVKGCFVDGALRGAAELRFLNGGHEEAEGAFCLEREFQGKGLGDKMFERLIHAARNRGVRRLFLTCLRENRRMQKIADHHGAELSFSAGDVMAEIRRPYADARSIASEWADEGEAFAFAVLEWRRKRFDFITSPIRRLTEAVSPSSRHP